MKLIYNQTLPAPPHGRRSWVRPIALMPTASSYGQQASEKHLYPLAGGIMSFAAVDIAPKKQDDSLIIQRMSVQDWQEAASDKAEAKRILDNLTKPRPDFAGLSMATPQIMGIVNATPDSFSDGGQHFDAQDGINGALAMAQQGATILM